MAMGLGLSDMWIKYKKTPGALGIHLLDAAYQKDIA